MKKQTVDIVEELISKLDIVVPFDVITDNGDSTYTIESCNTGYLFPCYKFELGGVTYTVLNEVGKEFVFNERFTIKGNSIPSAVQLIMDGLKYYHGTVIATKEELARKELSSDKFPMAFLLEVLEDDFDNRDDARIDRNSKLRLFFLSETDENNWNTEEHYEFSIKPMRNLLDKFITYLDRSSIIGKIDSYKAINHAKFGVYLSSKGGHTQRIFNDKLSGVELVIDLPIKKTKECNDCNTEPIVPVATITDSDGVSTFEVACGSTGACTLLNPINVSNSNDSYVANTLVDLELPNIDFTDSDGTTTSVPSMEDLVCTPAVPKSGIAYQRPLYNGAAASYRVNDEYWNFVNNPYSSAPEYPVNYARLSTYNTLVDVNFYGGYERFTDENGLQVYGNNYVIDHLTGLGITKTLITVSETWNDAIDSGTAFSLLGYTDFRLPSLNEIRSLLMHWMVGDRDLLQYAPFSLASGNVFYTSTTNPQITTYAFNTNLVLGVFYTTSTKTNTILGDKLYFRNHF